MKTAYKYDENGMWMRGEEIYVFPNYLDEYELPEGNYTFVEIPQPNWKPKFDGSKWIEIITDEELEDINNPPEEQPGEQSEIDYLKEKNIELETALLELTKISSAQETKVIELENALLEMSLILANNEEKVIENEEALLETTMLVGGMTNV